MWDPIDLSPIGMGMRENDTDFVNEVNAFIAGLNDTDGVYDALREKYDAYIAVGFSEQEALAIASGNLNIEIIEGPNDDSL